MMRIFTKKAFRFSEVGEPDVLVRPLSFSDVPDWVIGTALFRWARVDGDAWVTESRSDEASAEKETVDKDLASLRLKAKELGIKGASTMKQDTLEAKISDALESSDSRGE